MALPLQHKPFGATYPFLPKYDGEAVSETNLDILSNALADIAVEINPAMLATLTFPVRLIGIIISEGKIRHIELQDSSTPVSVGIIDTDAEGIEGQCALWGDHYHASLWETSNAVVRFVGRNNVSLDADLGDPNMLVAYFLPPYGTGSAVTDPTYKELKFSIPIDPVCVTVRPQRVNAFQVSGHSMPGEIWLQQGYNAEFSRGAATRNAPGPTTTKVYLSLAGGSGLGFPPGCGGEDPVLRELGGVNANNSGTIQLDVAGCYSLYTPATISNDEGTVTANSLTLRNDCGTCTPCSAYEAVYNAMRRLNDSFLGIGSRVDSINSKYRTLRNRWLVQKTCRESSPVRVLLVAGDGGDGKTWVKAVVTYGNNTGTCVGQVAVRLDWTTSAGVTAPTLYTQNTRRSMATNARPHPYALGGSWPTYTADWDYVPPGNPVRVTADFLFDYVTPGSWVKLTATPLINGIEVADAAWEDVVILGIPT